MVQAKLSQVGEEVPTKPKTEVVNKTASGSLLPDSNSKREVSPFLIPILLVLRTLNTAAASVEDTIAPKRNPIIGSKPITKIANKATNKQVRSTPKVPREIPFQSTGFTLVQSVSKPPENKMNANAMEPTLRVRSASLNQIIRMPSEPANIPIDKKISREGIPNFVETRNKPMLNMMRLERAKI